MQLIAMNELLKANQLGTVIGGKYPDQVFTIDGNYRIEWQRQDNVFVSVDYIRLENSPQVFIKYTDT